MRVSVTRDTWVSAADGERDKNLGGATRLKTKGTQELTILDMDPAALRGRVVERATLHLHSASQDILRRVSVSTVASEWVEGTAASYERVTGAASFDWAEQDVRPWSYTGSDITSVIFGSGHTTWRFADASALDDRGWQSIAVDADVVAARVAGISAGFAVMDDVGSEYERDGDRFAYHMFLNRFAHSREEGDRRAPYFLVELGEEDREPPEAVGRIAVDTVGLPGGEARLSWNSPVDRGVAGTIGFFARVSNMDEFTWERAIPVPRYLIPMAGARGDTITMHLCDLGFEPGSELDVGIASVDRAGNVAAPKVTRVKLATTPDAVELATLPERTVDTGVPLDEVRVGGVAIAVLDALDKVHPVSGAILPPRDDAYRRSNHLWSARERRIQLESARNEFVEFQLLFSGEASEIEAAVTLDDPAIQVALYRPRYVSTASGPLPDPLVPHTGAFAIPARDAPIAGERHASIHFELYIPHELEPGLRKGEVTLRVGESKSTIPIELRVWSFVLADHLSFLTEMNAYWLPAPPADREYYRLAHRHRATLNRLGYNWRGEVNDHCGPRWDGARFDWTEYDAHYGPLLDGSAFADLPRRGVPVDAFYLPLNENWPHAIEPAFRGGYWADEALLPSYLDAFANAAKEFAAHAAAKRWNQTLFESYLNNKVYFKESSWSRASAPWVFDEPMNTQDFWALRTYGLAFHRGIAGYADAAKLVYRCDISRPEWQRDLLDDVADVLVVGSSFRKYGRTVTDRKRANGEVVIEYSTANAVDEPNTMPVAWCIDAWSRGADGVVPWQTIGNDASWSQGDALSLFYPGAPIGSSGPVASARLKAFRRGQQDVEYLTMLQLATGSSREAIAELVRRELALDARMAKSFAEDAGRLRYDGVDAAALWRLRARVGATLDRIAPPAKRRWVELAPKRPREPAPPAQFHVR